MSSIVVTGGGRLEGKTVIQGSKNLAVPCLAASILFDDEVTFYNVPDISDVRGSLNMLRCLGAKTVQKGNTVTIDPKSIKSCTLCDESGVCGGGRSSILYCGPLLAKYGKCSCVSPGGCKIGKRPTDLHQMIFKAFGADSERKENEDNSNLSFCAEEWRGCAIELPIRSVGATESAVLSAVLAEGRTDIYGYAKEPEIVHLCEFLCSAGADISFDEAADRITVNGVKKLNSCCFRLSPDRIVAGTYMIYCCICGGNVRLIDAPACELGAVIYVLKKAGAVITQHDGCIDIAMNKRPVSVGVVETDYYPGFPTDMQSLLLALESISEGSSIVVENIFESRFETANLLKKMGAGIEIEGNTAYINGTVKLTNRDLAAPDLRGGAAVLGAMMAADGKATLSCTEVIDRGYEDIAGDLKKLGFAGLED